MSQHVLLVRERSGADDAAMWLFSRVSPDVTDHVAPLPELPPAHLARVRLLYSMDPHVYPQTLASSESPAAYFAAVWFQTRVNQHVSF